MKSEFRFSSLFLASLWLLPPLFAGANLPAAADPAGTWTWTTLNRNGQPQQDKLTLAIAKDGTLTGTLADRSGTSAITKASFSNGLLQFSVIHVTPNAKLETTYTGQLTGNTLSLSSQRPDPAPAAAAQNKKRTADIVATLIPANEVKPVVPLPKLGGG